MATVKLKNELTLALSVKNRAQSADWYTKHLGFEVSMAIDEAGWTEQAVRQIEEDVEKGTYMASANVPGFSEVADK